MGVFLEKLLNIGFKIALVLAILAGLMIGALKLLERQQEPLQQGIEQYFTEASGMDAKIGNMERISFFPNLDLVFQDLSFYSVSDPDLFPMRVETVTLKMPFNAVFFGRRVFEVIDVRNLEAKPDVITPKALRIDQAMIVDDGQTDPFVHILGQYDEAEMEAKIGLERHRQTTQRTIYKIGDTVSFYTQIGAIYLTGTFEHGWQGSVFRDAVLKIGPETYGPENLAFQAQSATISLLQCLIEYGAQEADVTEHCTHYFKTNKNAIDG